MIKDKTLIIFSTRKVFVGGLSADTKMGNDYC